MPIEEDSLRQILERHRAFWQCGATDRPLLGNVRSPRNPREDFNWGLPEAQGKLEPEMIVVDHFLPPIEADYQTGGLLDGDIFWPAAPTRSIPWLEAIMGASIRYSNDHGVVSIFSEAVIKDWDQIPGKLHHPE